MLQEAVARLRMKTVELVYGLNEAGQLMHISEVPSGNLCNSRCPACNAPLVAKKGPDNAHHFAHQADRACNNAPETALHKLAKQIGSNRLLLKLPAVVAKYLDRSQEIYPETVVQFDRATPEARQFSDVVPDLYVERSGRGLLVEFLVTHACDELKREKLRRQGIAAVEIDLSDVKRDASPAIIEQVVLYGAPRVWVFHPEIERVVALMRGQEEERQRTVNEVIERSVSQYQAKFDDGCRAIAAQPQKKLTKNNLVVRLELVQDIGIDVGGAGCFKVPYSQWQYQILGSAFLNREDETHATYQAKSLVDWLKKNGKIRQEFKFINRETEKLLNERIAGFRSPYRAVEVYLEVLVERGVLSKRRGYALSHGLLDRITTMRETDNRREARRRDITERLAKILSALPDEERGTFGAEDAFMLKQKSGLSFDAAIEADHQSFTQLEFALSEIEAMIFRKGRIVENTLGLPIEAECERQQRTIDAKEKERETARLAKLIKEKEDRQECLRQAAEVLGDDAIIWSESVHAKLSGRTPIEMAIAGSKELGLALEELDNEIQQRREAKASAEKLVALRARLEAGCTQILGEFARPFLVSPYALGNGRGKVRPIDYCTTEATLRQCLELAQRVHRERR